MIFNKWKQYLGSELELRPVELSGRGSRIKEPCYESLAEAVDDVFQLIKDDIRHEPYALFGHSMGSMIAYGLAQKIRDYNLLPPMHIFFSGRGAPHVKKRNDKKYHLMNEQDFKKELIALGGTPPDLFKHPELLNLFLPVLRKDFKIVETYVHSDSIRPLDTNITIFLGKDDDISYEQCVGWKKHTTRLCSIHYFEGDHFFLNSQTASLVKIINDTMSEACIKLNILQIQD